MTQVVPEPGAVTGDPVIDGTTVKLTALLVRVMNSIEVDASSLTPQEYGRLVHEEFADDVRVAVLPGIAYDDVETTFPNGPYGSPDSIRTDVVLRNDDGDIIAIYDVKTGRGLGQARVDQLRDKTGSADDTPVIELRFDGPILKYLVGQLHLQKP
jgi:hypothetical protein